MGSRKPVQRFYARSRLQIDLAELERSQHYIFQPHAHVEFELDNSQITQQQSGAESISFYCRIVPKEGAYCDGRFDFRFDIPNEYPFRAPSITATTPLFHPNVDASNGAVSLRLVSTDWSPVVRLETLVLGVVLLFVEPNMDSAVNQQCTDLLLKSPGLFLGHAQECAKQSRKGEIQACHDNISLNRESSPSSGATMNSILQDQPAFGLLPKKDFYTDCKGGRKRSRTTAENILELREASQQLQNLELQSDAKKLRTF